MTQAIHERERERERRSAPRIVAKLAMQVTGGEDGSVLTTESVNLSASGIQFLSRAFLSPLTKVMLTLLLPPFGRTLRRERMVQCEGIVVRCEEVEGSRSHPRYELACYFIEAADEDRALIEDYVAWRTLRRVPGGARASTRSAAAGASASSASSAPASKNAAPRARKSGGAAKSARSKPGASARSAATGKPRRRSANS